MRWADRLRAVSMADRKRLGDLVARNGNALDLFPLSYTQEWFWWTSRLQRGSEAANTGVTLRLEGTVDDAVLDRSLREIVSRHEILRSSFHPLGRITVQAAEAVPDRLLETADLRYLPAAEQRERARELIGEQFHRPFPLDDGRMLRVLLLRLSGDDALLALITHRLVFDDWSIGILVRELRAAYPAAREERPSGLEPLPIQYADFAAWQRGWLDEARLEKEYEYWRDRIGEVPVLLDLPADRPRPAVRRPEGTLHDLVLGPERTERLRRLCGRAGATPYMGLTAVFHLWLARLTGQHRFVTSALAAYRERPEVAGLIGDFSNMITIPAAIDERVTFHELLARTTEAVLESQEHAEMPGHRLTGKLRPGRDDSHGPLSQAMFLSVHAMHALSGVDLGGLVMRLERVADEMVATSAFDIEARLVEKPGTLVVQFLFTESVFEPSSADPLAAQFEALVDAVLADPGAPLASLAPMAKPEASGPVETPDADRLGEILAALPAGAGDPATRTALAKHWLAAGSGPDVPVQPGPYQRLPEATGEAVVLRAIGPAGRELWPFPAGEDRGRGPELRPVPGGAVLWAADTDGRRRPVGAVGELHLTGRSVPGTLATGLLGRETQRGTVEVLGPVAQEREVRGFRLRPAEIRWVLIGLPDVADAEVWIEPDGVVAARLDVRSGDPDHREWERRVRGALPAFARPARLDLRPVEAGASSEEVGV